MIHDMRIYRTMPGRMPALLKRFETHMLKICERMGIRQLGLWTNVIGRSQLEQVYLLIWHSLAEREAKWDASMQDTESPKALAELEAVGFIVADAANTLTKPTRFSALQQGCGGTINAPPARGYADLNLAASMVLAWSISKISGSKSAPVHSTRSACSGCFGSARMSSNSS